MLRETSSRNTDSYSYGHSFQVISKVPYMWVLVLVRFAAERVHGTRTMYQSYVMYVSVLAVL
eukprot:scaffold97602_cov17-Prasinocladus_malaysianus.AAC.1